MALFKCKMCGGELEITQGMTVCECPYCGTKQTLPKLDDEKKIKLYDRANHFRRNNEYDKAMGIYETILSEDSEDAEAYWSLVLCRYGIEYVEDPATHKRIPTVNRAQYTSVFIDDDYQSAIKYADGYQRDVYENEAKAIDDIQKGILEISSKEEPFDVFICYKETDHQGRRAQDSVYAQSIYDELTKEGYKVFFSRITLEDKLGSAYEPYIFAALNSAKVMIAVGTSTENFNAVWVRNEWSRYLAMIKAGEEKTLIPVYSGMDPYDLPDEFSYLQAQDMSKIGFMQDLVRGVKKLISQEVIDTRQKVGTTSVIVDTMSRRASEALANGEWDTAFRCYESILDYDSGNTTAYVGKLLATNKVNELEKLSDLKSPLENDKNYQLAIRYADEKLKAKLEECNKIIVDRIKAKKKRARIRNITIIVSILIAVIISATIYAYPRFIVPLIVYNQGFQSIKNSDYEKAISGIDDARLFMVSSRSAPAYYDTVFKTLTGYDRVELIEEFRRIEVETYYHYVCDLMERGEYKKAYDIIITDVKRLAGDDFSEECNERRKECAYALAKQYEEAGDMKNAELWYSVSKY